MMSASYTFPSTNIEMAAMFRLYLKFILGLLNLRREIAYLFLTKRI